MLDIDRCEWDDLKYWNDWHLAMCKAEDPDRVIKPKKILKLNWRN